MNDSYVKIFGLITGMILTIVVGLCVVNCIIDQVTSPSDIPSCDNGTLNNYCISNTYYANDHIYNTLYWCKGYDNSTSPVNMDDCKIVE